MENYFMTPRGAKIRVSVQEAFTLMARLYPTKKPADILKTVEGIESVPSLFSTIAIIIGLLVGFNGYGIIIVAAGATILALLLINFGLLLSYTFGSRLSYRRLQR